jgi:hypothetical protein
LEQLPAKPAQSLAKSKNKSVGFSSRLNLGHARLISRVGFHAFQEQSSPSRSPSLLITHEDTKLSHHHDYWQSGNQRPQNRNAAAIELELFSSVLAQGTSFIETVKPVSISIIIVRYFRMIVTSCC